MNTAEKFIEQKGYPKNTSIEVLPETGESTYFKEYFGDWKHVEESPGLKHFNLRPPKVKCSKFLYEPLAYSLWKKELFSSLFSCERL